MTHPLKSVLTALAASAAILALGACASPPDASVGTGATVPAASQSGGGNAGGIQLAQPSGAPDGETPIVLGDLKAGDRINVWTGECRESNPVQCDVEAVTAPGSQRVATASDTWASAAIIARR